eukprot:2726872-Prymnesium_polylepis.1
MSDTSSAPVPLSKSARRSSSSNRRSASMARRSVHSRRSHCDGRAAPSRHRRGVAIHRCTRSAVSACSVVDASAAIRAARTLGWADGLRARRWARSAGCLATAWVCRPSGSALRPQDERSQPDERPRGLLPTTQSVTHGAMAQRSNSGAAYGRRGRAAGSHPRDGAHTACARRNPGRTARRQSPTSRMCTRRSRRAAARRSPLHPNSAAAAAVRVAGPHTPSRWSAQRVADGRNARAVGGPRGRAPPRAAQGRGLC